MATFFCFLALTAGAGLLAALVVIACGPSIYEDNPEDEDFQRELERDGENFQSDDYESKE